ncbi:MAG: 2-oxoacid:acceptor oxidoreductase family protein [Candidatus Thorarchaeota archaeon]
MKTEIRIAGTGGMGVVLAGVILGHAAAVYGGLEVVQSQSYGSEARGTAAKSEVILSDCPIKYPKVRESDYFIVMSQKALEMYLDGAKKNSVLIVDPDLVNTKDVKGFEILEVTAMKTADKLGLRLVSNMVMLGAFVKKSGLLSIGALEKAVSELISARTSDIDIKAIQAGAELV